MNVCDNGLQSMMTTHINKSNLINKCNLKMKFIFIMHVQKLSL